MAQAGAKLTLDHKFIASELNQCAWALLENESRSPEENDEMLHVAHASLWHWLQAGSKVHHQRGLWLLGRVHVLLGKREAAMYYARQTMDLTEAHQEDMADFDHAYAFELLARATLLAGEDGEAAVLFERAARLGQLIHGEQNRKILFTDLKAIPYRETELSIRARSI